MRINKGKRHFFIFVLLLLIACDAEVDKTGDLGGGYNFRADGGMMWISGLNVYEDGVPGNVTDYISNSEYILAKQEPSRDYYHNFFTSDLTSRYRYLLYHAETVQNPNEYHKRFMSSKWWSDTGLKNKISKYIDSDNHDTREEICKLVDSVITYDPYYKKIFSSAVNYWILVKQGNRVYGPFTKKQFIKKRSELLVPKELQLDE